MGTATFSGRRRKRWQSPSQWATVLDAAIILFGSAGIVIALGGGARFALGSVRITTASALRPFVVVGALLVLRLLIDRRNPPLPAMPRGELDTSPARFKAAAPVDKQVRWCALAVVLGSIVWIWPHLTHLRRIPDAGDPVFSAWRIARIAHQLAHDPLHLFAGNIFYPLRLTMTYSDATLLQSVIGAPFILAGIDPLVVANGVFLLAFPGCALAFFYASWRLTGDPRAAVIAGLIGTWYPFHFEHYSHMELRFPMFVPLAMLAVLKLVATPTLSARVLLGMTIALQWLGSTLGLAAAGVVPPLSVPTAAILVSAALVFDWARPI